MIMQESRASQALLKETKEELLLTISLYNLRLYTQEKYVKKMAGAFWWSLLIMCFTFPCDKTGLILYLFISSAITCVICFLCFILSIFNIFILEDVPLLKDPEGAASYHLAKGRKNRPINTESLRTQSNEWMENLYITFISEEMKSDRDLVKHTLKEAALRQLMIDRIDVKHCFVPISSSHYEEEEEDDYVTDEEDE